MILAWALGASIGCGGEAGAGDRGLGPGSLELAISGSLQNPCWSPAGDRLLITRFREGYNRGPADLLLVDLLTVDLGGVTPEPLTRRVAQNVNLPGSCWRGDRLVFSSDAVGRDEIWRIDLGGADPRPITDRPGQVAFEPSLSPDGAWIVFESHPEDVDEQGALWKVRADGSDLTQLTDGAGDDREPNWSPAGDLIVFQSLRSGNWDIWVIDSDGDGAFNVTAAPSEDTDASWSPDGESIVYSSDAGGLEVANVFVIPVEGGEPRRVRDHRGYDGAPAWSPDGRLIALESAGADPDGPGTQIVLVAAPRTP